MADSSGAGGSHRVRRRRRRSHSEPRGRRQSSARGEHVARPELDIAELRRLRIEKLDDSVLARSSTVSSTMTSHSRSKESQPKPPSSENRKKSHHRSHKSSATNDQRSSNDHADEESKDKPETTRNAILESRKVTRDRESGNPDGVSVQTRHARHKAEDRARIAKHGSHRHQHGAVGSKGSDRSIHRDKAHTSRRKSVDEPRRERSSSKDLAVDTKSSLKRSSSTGSSHKTPYKMHTKESASISGATTAGRRSSILGSLFSSTLPTHPEEPPRLVECLKWHGAKDCPKDEETNKLLETAKEAGWQRCYNCRAMVELKEGCNHMTCRCTAEFCMICGLKWKSCNCPWFNYDAAEQDRLNHMRIPEPVFGIERQRPGNPGQAEQPARVRRRANRPQTYNEEISLRRRQERMDEIIARRLQGLTLNDHNDDYQGGVGDIHGIGNAAGHFMNEDFIRVAHNLLEGNFNQAAAAANFAMRAGRQRDRIPAVDPIRGEPAPARPIVRRHTLREVPITDPRPGRAAERLIHRRTRTDYATEAAIYAPLSRSMSQQTSASVSTSTSKRESQSPPPSVLAGLGPKSGRGRVDQWRAHVEPGVQPEENVISE
ncbi:hypothetical protein B7463_g1043, partial [Scytalidium lignicola]